MAPEQLQNFYRQRADRLAFLSLAEVLAELDKAWLIENESSLLTAKSMATLTTHCLQRTESPHRFANTVGSIDQEKLLEFNSAARRAGDEIPE